MPEKFTDEVRTILEAAQQQALMNYNQEVTTAHLLAAMCDSEEGFLSYVLSSLKIDAAAFKAAAKALVTKLPGVKGSDRQLVYGTGLLRVLSLAQRRAGQQEIDSGLLLSLLASDGDSDVIALLRRYGLDSGKLEAAYGQYKTQAGSDEEKKVLEKGKYFVFRNRCANI